MLQSNKMKMEIKARKKHSECYPNFLEKYRLHMHHEKHPSIVTWANYDDFD